MRLIGRTKTLRRLSVKADGELYRQEWRGNQSGSGMQREAGPCGYLMEHLDRVPTHTSGAQTPPPLGYRTDSSPSSTFLLMHSDSIKMFSFFLGTQFIRVLSYLVTKENKKQKKRGFGSVRTAVQSHSPVLFSQTHLTASDASAGGYGRTFAVATPTKGGVGVGGCNPRRGGRWVAYVRG